MEDCNTSKYPIEAKLQLVKDVEGILVDSKEYRCIIGCLSYCSIVLRTLVEKLVERGARMRAEVGNTLVDNKSTIELMKNAVFHGCNKHIDTRFHFIRECVENRQIVVGFVSTREQCVDIFTKALAKVKFAEMRELLGMKNIEPNQTYRGDCEFKN
ncbi:uncharacterized protein LOC124946291 [Impatiens glandulifera]|uniref:uncharacterized protein LOC124946291 n=1 Tax=Impatiens glandulifera TaxID=253017 RepID=UPI001FB13F92|nr:uncharacterized protein LOC124946291 [Impatiens glandulifera]